MDWVNRAQRPSNTQYQLPQLEELGGTNFPEGDLSCVSSQYQPPRLEELNETLFPEGYLSHDKPNIAMVENHLRHALSRIPDGMLLDLAADCVTLPGYALQVLGTNSDRWPDWFDTAWTKVVPWTRKKFRRASIACQSCRAAKRRCTRSEGYTSCDRCRSMQPELICIGLERKNRRQTGSETEQAAGSADTRADNASTSSTSQEHCMRDPLAPQSSVLSAELNPPGSYGGANYAQDIGDHLHPSYQSWYQH